MTNELIQKLRELAEKYEVPDFCTNDPSRFLRWYEPEKGRGTVADVEAASFIAAMLAFGNRKQFIPKIEQILQIADRSKGSVSSWLKSNSYKNDFPNGNQKFYRFYSFNDMQIFFEELAKILNSSTTLGTFLQEGKAFPSLQPATQSSATLSNGGQKLAPRNAPQALPLCDQLALAFPRSAIVPKGRTSANKRINMFLRWMVRRNSPVDLGLWQWADPAALIIPLDTHVMHEAAGLNLIPQKCAASRKTAELLTAALCKAFPNDPCRGDFALFGLGVDESQNP
ncbi:MAG: TIGR02757 family protein [Treponema sp.]|nr:TIGR02757 family protein [Treponema sp.]